MYSKMMMAMQTQIRQNAKNILNSILFSLDN